MGESKKQKKAQRVRQKMLERQPSKASQIKDLMRRLDKMYPETKGK
jgi:hypothetical protein